ncbi:hypothetical protein ACIP25_30670 [Streptomyces massasporeus]|uniref:hypothetical protein n=1 Tax=Streptomyces massasporeus TaxID=67324 RepID=UPI00380650FB
MTEHRDVTSNRFEFYTYRLGRSQLDRLFSIAAEGFRPEQLKFETERGGTSFTRSTLEELVSSVAASPLPGDPDEWSNLSFQAIEDWKHISIDITRHWLRVSISGPDATWVHGQAARLKAIVEPVAGTIRPSELRSRRAAKISLAAGLLAGLAAFLIGQGTPDLTTGGAITGAIMVATVMGTIVFWIGIAGKGKTRTLISVTGEISDRRWWQDLSMADKIALGSLAVTTLAAIAAFLSAYADVWGS